MRELRHARDLRQLSRRERWARYLVCGIVGHLQRLLEFNQRYARYVCPRCTHTWSEPRPLTASRRPDYRAGPP